MPRAPIPAAEVDVGETLVRALLRDQHPDLADLPAVEVAGGWDNVIFRLGEDLAVRLPRREVAVPAVEREQRWLPVLAPRLPVPVPVPVRLGRPGHGYPWPWSVTPWFRGDTGSRTGPLDTSRAAASLARFLVALHQPAPAEAPRSTFRGVPLADRTERIVTCANACASLIDVPAVLRRWDALVSAAPWQGAPLWIHGDLHPGNILVNEGTVAAVLDFGDLCAGDPATDLAAAWLLLASDMRAVFMATVEAAGVVDVSVWQRAQGWVLALSIVWLAHAENDAQVTRECVWAVREVLKE